MAEESVRELFMRAHALVDAQGSEIRELLAADVSPSKVLTLYPYSFQSWLAGLAREREASALKNKAATARSYGYGTATWRGIRLGDSELHARLRGVQSAWMRNGMPQQLRGWAREQEDECVRALRSEAGQNYLSQLGFGLGSGDINALLNLFCEASLTIAFGSHWEEMRGELGKTESEYRDMLLTILNALLPDHFPMERPLVTFDTMMFSQ